eukprot:13482514-Alexandrium_andersonii.AAC.1
MLYQPEHRRAAHRDLPLDPPLQRQRQGADYPLELPRRVFDGAIVSDEVDPSGIWGSLKK